MPQEPIGSRVAGWVVRDPHRILRNACLEAKEECPVGGCYANVEDALDDMRAWFKKWAHQLYFPKLDQFAKVAVENGWWLCTKIQIGERARPPYPMTVPHATVYVEARTDAPAESSHPAIAAVPSSWHGDLKQQMVDEVWLTLALEPWPKASNVR
jgi:hypothetical protein